MVASAADQLFTIIQSTSVTLSSFFDRHANSEEHFPRYSCRFNRSHPKNLVITIMTSKKEVAPQHWTDWTDWTDC